MGVEFRAHVSFSGHRSVRNGGRGVRSATADVARDGHPMGAASAWHGIF